MKLAKIVDGSNGRHSTGGVGGETNEAEEELGVEAEDDNSTEGDTMAEDALSYVQTALARRRRRVCSCSSQTDLRHLAHSFLSPTPGTGSPTTSLLGFNILGR